MKTKFFLFLFSTLFVSAFGNPVNKKSTRHPVAVNPVSSVSADISFLRTHKLAQGVSINWGVTSSEGVAAFVVERTYQDPGDPYAMWENITSVPGSPSSTYKYEDENVFPGTITYRVTMVMTNGAVTAPFISTITIVQRN
jgi:hypothetical protein